MPSQYPHAIHMAEAIKLLSDGHPHRLRVWKMQTGEALLYERATRVGRHTKGAAMRVKLDPSGQIRQFREICLFEIDDMTIYL